jgi:hypothetical protein
MLTYDPIPWLMAQEGLTAIRARRLLGLTRAGDEEAVAVTVRELAAEQRADGSFEDSPMRTAGVLNLLDDLRADDAGAVIAGGTSYLFSVLESQRGYARTKEVAPGSLTTPCDLGGFFGPYEERGRPEAMAHGAREMNFYRAYEPLLGPKSPVRGVRRSSLDRAGPASCYSWGLIPLSYTVEALCRVGCARDERLRPAINALLGAQRESGGWCRNLGGHPSCTLHGLCALGAHPDLRGSEHAARALELLRAGRKGLNAYALLQVCAAFDLPVAHEIICDVLATLAPRQRKNGTYGTPCRVERVAAVLVAARAVGGIAT